MSELRSPRRERVSFVRDGLIAARPVSFVRVFSETSVWKSHLSTLTVSD